MSGAIGQLQQNVSALWAKLDEMSGMDRQSSGGVHIHAGDGHVEHVHDHGDDGQHLHMHMHIDSGCDDHVHHGHDHDGRRHDRMHAHANTRGNKIHFYMKFRQTQMYKNTIFNLYLNFIFKILLVFLQKIGS